MGVVWIEELLVGLRPGAGREGIAPSVEQVAPLPATAALVAGGLGGRRAVVDDPDLAEIPGAQHDLVELGVVGDRVDVAPFGEKPTVTRRSERAYVPEALELFDFAVPLRISPPFAPPARQTGSADGFSVIADVDIDQFGMFGQVAGIRPGRVVVLDRVIPGVPLPDDIPGRLASRIDLDDRVGQPSAVDPPGIAAGGP